MLFGLHDVILTSPVPVSHYSSVLSFITLKSNRSNSRNIRKKNRFECSWVYGVGKYSNFLFLFLFLTHLNYNPNMDCSSFCNLSCCPKNKDLGVFMTLLYEVNIWVVQECSWGFEYRLQLPKFYIIETQNKTIWNKPLKYRDSLCLDIISTNKTSTAKKYQRKPSWWTKVNIFIYFIMFIEH